NSFNRFNNGEVDAIVTKMNVSGDHLIFSTYIGGGGFDGAYDIDVDDEGNVYVVGTTSSMGFPASDFAYDRTYNGGLTDVFLCKLNVSGKRLLYTTFYGGGDEDFGTGIAYLDNSCVFVTGYTSSTNLPTTPGSLSPSFRGGAFDGFISLFNLSMTPSKVEDFRSYHGDEEVRLSWKPPVDKGGMAPMMYRIYRGITPGYMNEVGVVSETTFLDTGLTNGEKYLHQVAVFNDIGQGPMSDVLTTKPRSIPSEPLNLDLEWGDENIILRWTPPSDTGGLNINAYNIYRGEAAGSLEYLRGLKNVLEYTDKGVVNGVTYYYGISANNTEGEGPMGAGSSAIPASVPGNPVKLTILPGDKRILLGWDGPDDVGGSPILGYNIYRGVWGTNLSLYTTLEPVTSYDDVDVVNGVIYNYSISAFNEIGEGEMGPSIYSTPGSIPDIVLDLQGLPGYNMATLSWSPPAENGGFDLTGYRVYRGRDIENMRLIGDLVQDTSYIDRNIKNGKLFHYKVSGVNVLGEGPFSQIIDVIPSSVPNPPRNLEPTIGIGHINISWEAPGDDGGSPITGYNVYRGIGSLDWVLLASLPNITTYEDNNVTINLIYRYRVSAINMVGEGDSSEVNDLFISIDDIQIVETTEESESLLWVLLVIIIVVVVVLTVLIGVGIVVINIREKKGGHYPHFDPEMFKD
ncbi:MAG: SBBP repeat-containing protein, partial [Thermoplasmata archaeon]|nr:SBBP repeat-containing protein [Thermoplasmata archaeon]